ncbi:MFS transporter [Vibrio gazogenes]|uniref:1-acyl-sn-glycerol-3-phosphate acyltransferases n=1 Tax=Vibrio gazogenes DSM 21264 = NBRC 103151 TaxID=1123492 RepID=A0A1M5FYT1_VIBGA|nr:MFS transporter [Vibrio gazogenes]USP14707.1 MFS transporter [Vibrio gazogenes]SHF96717.1 1-acyl-sn-glycerol-3-phosphate acyltransferases [Vibrio gazogenes DSM 21264] [Vibrio gazogenes DSM 21264 = NBRC 103151]SJN52913.1 Lysophospholipid transporter LplT [Vibrio gazogenes]
MSHTTSSLLSSRRFLPYFITQFFGAFNDNVFKNTLLLFVAFSSAGQLAISSTLFINLAAGLFILPFFLFSASSGVLADQLEKSQLIRKIKMLEVVIMSLAAIGFITHSYLILLLLLFLMGTQSALFGPVKYALLPQQLKPDELMSGNALVETGTFLAILLGTLLAGVIASTPSAEYIAAGAVVVVALCGYLASCYIPNAPATAPSQRFQWRPISQTRNTLRIAKQDPVIHRTILIISWFWFMGATYLTQFPNFTRYFLHGNEGAVSWLLTLFSVGIALGSLLCDRLSRHRIELGLVPLACLGISLFGCGLVAGVPDALPQTMDFTTFITNTGLWPLFVSLLLLGVSGGMFIVPLYTLLQQRAHPDQRAQVIAALNIYNALFMVISAILAIIVLSLLQWSIPELFLLLSLINLGVAVYLLYKRPIETLRFVLACLAKLCYRVRYRNLHHLPPQGGALIICNHVTYLDALILSAASPRLIRFVMEADYTTVPLIRPVLNRAGVIPICASHGKTIRKAFIQIEQALQQGELVCIFPEGCLSSDGEIGPFLRGLDHIIQHTSAPIIPMALKGMWGSYFSRHRGRACRGFPQRFRAKIEVEAAPPIVATDTSSEQLRQHVAQLRGAWR